MTEHTFEFEFPYLIAGGTAAYFECRCHFRLTPGRKGIYRPPPGLPPQQPEVEEVWGVEVNIGKYDAKTGTWNQEWAIPDPALAQRIYDYLATQHAGMIERAGADA